MNVLDLYLVFIFLTSGYGCSRCLEMAEVCKVGSVSPYSFSINYYIEIPFFNMRNFFLILHFPT
jgi:hypothetical protein